MTKQFAKKMTSSADTQNKWITSQQNEISKQFIINRTFYYSKVIFICINKTISLQLTFKASFNYYTKMPFTPTNGNVKNFKQYAID